VWQRLSTSVPRNGLLTLSSYLFPCGPIRCRYLLSDLTYTGNNICWLSKRPWSPRTQNFFLHIFHLCWVHVMICWFPRISMKGCPGFILLQIHFSCVLIINWVVTLFCFYYQIRPAYKGYYSYFHLALCFEAPSLQKGWLICNLESNH
jgi:hypothetical protein